MQVILENLQWLRLVFIGYVGVRSFRYDWFRIYFVLCFAGVHSNGM